MKTFKPGDKVHYYNPSSASNAQKIKVGTFVREIKPQSWARRLVFPRWCLVQFLSNKRISRVMIRDLDLYKAGKNDGN